MAPNLTIKLHSETTYTIAVSPKTSWEDFWTSFQKTVPYGRYRHFVLRDIKIHSKLKASERPQVLKELLKGGELSESPFPKEFTLVLTYDGNKSTLVFKGLYYLPTSDQIVELMRQKHSPLMNRLFSVGAKSYSLEKDGDRAEILGALLRNGRRMDALKNMTGGK